MFWMEKDHPLPCSRHEGIVEVDEPTRQRNLTRIFTNQRVKKSENVCNCPFSLANKPTIG